MQFIKGHKQLNTGRTHFKKGRIPWNKGKKGLQIGWGKGEKRGSNPLLSLAKKGKPTWNKGLTFETDNRILSGENHYHWKGGISKERDMLKHKKEYIIWRTAVFMRDDYTCQWCGAINIELNADHIKPWALYPELRYAIDNGRTLCVPCHRQTDTYGGRVFWKEGEK